MRIFKEEEVNGSVGWIKRLVSSGSDVARVWFMKFFSFDSGLNMGSDAQARFIEFCNLLLYLLSLIIYSGKHSRIFT